MVGEEIIMPMLRGVHTLLFEITCYLLMQQPAAGLAHAFIHHLLDKAMLEEIGIPSRICSIDRNEIVVLQGCTLLLEFVGSAKVGMGRADPCQAETTPKNA